MKKVTFIKAGARNFCVYQELIEFEFKNNKICMITGPNGTGKTTLIDILPFSLYGTTSKGLRSDDVVNNKVNKNCYAFSEFLISDDLYKVERYVKDSKEGDSVYLYKNNVLIKKGHREVVPEVENILVPYKLFTNTLFFGQKVKTFFTDLADSDQKEIFRKVLQLDNYVDYYDFTSKKIKELTEELDDIEHNIDLKNSMLISCKDDITRLKNDKDKFESKKETDIQDKRKNIEYYKSEIVKLKSDYIIEIEKLTEKINSMMDNQQQIKVEYERLKGEKDSKKTELTSKKEVKESQIEESYSRKLGSINKEFSDKLLEANKENQKEVLEIEKKISDLTSKNKSLEKSINTLKDNRAKILDEMKMIESNLLKEVPICFACNQKVGQAEIEKLRFMLDEKQKQDSTFSTDLAKQTKEYNSNGKELITLRESLKELKQKMTDSETKIDTQKLNEIKSLDGLKEESLKKLQTLFESKILEIDNHYNKILEDMANNFKQIKEIFEIEDKNLKSLKEEQAKKIALESLEEKAKAEIEEINKREFNDEFLNDLVLKEKNLISELEVFNQTRDEKKIQLRIHEFWKSAFSMAGIPSMLIDEAIPYMNERISFYLDQIGGRYQVSFDTINETKSGEYRDKIKINVLDTITKANSRKQLSSGQVRIVDIATIFTLRDLQSIIQNIEINILLLDEIFDSLDEANISYVSTLLRKMVNGRSINIISHRHIDQIECDEVFRTI